MTFYLIPLQDVENDPPVDLTVSQTTIDLCLQALISAEDRFRWREELEELSDTEWEQAVGYLTTAIEELTS
jgi:hypothetical protein